MNIPPKPYLYRALTGVDAFIEHLKVHSLQEGDSMRGDISVYIYPTGESNTMEQLLHTRPALGEESSGRTAGRCRCP